MIITSSLINTTDLAGLNNYHNLRTLQATAVIKSVKICNEQSK